MEDVSAHQVKPMTQLEVLAIAQEDRHMMLEMDFVYVQPVNHTTKLEDNVSAQPDKHTTQLEVCVFAQQVNLTML